MVYILSDQLASLAKGLVEGLADRFRWDTADSKPQPLLSLLSVISYNQLDLLPVLGQLP